MFTRKEIIFLRFPSWNTETALHCILHFMFWFYTWKESLSHWPVEAGLWIISDRLYPPELSDRFRGFFFALVFAFLKRASLIGKKNPKKTPNTLKPKKLSFRTTHVNVTFFSQQQQLHFSSSIWSHQLALAACSCSAYALAQPFHKRFLGKKRIQEEKKKTLSNLDLVSGLLYCTQTSAETEEDTAAAQAGTAT